jgi:hypothetical protein
MSGRGRKVMMASEAKQTVPTLYILIEAPYELEIRVRQPNFVAASPAGVELALLGTAK